MVVKISNTHLFSSCIGAALSYYISSPSLSTCESQEPSNNMAIPTPITTLILTLITILSTVSTATATGNNSTSNPSPWPWPWPRPINPDAKDCSTDPVQLVICSPVIHKGPLWPMNQPCCGLLGLFGMELQACLCLALKCNILGMSVDMPVALNMLMSFCQFTISPAFICRSSIASANKLL